MTTPTPAQLPRRGIRLEYATLGWNVPGAVVLAGVAPAAHSVALVGFGFDTLLEIGASTVVIWELRGPGGPRQARALRLLSGAFLLLSLYLLGQTGWSLTHRVQPRPSALGLGWVALTGLVLLALAAGKRRVGRQLGNAVLQTESRVTLMDAALAGAVLLGLALNAALGWWWADGAVGLLLAAYCLAEARHAWREAGPR